VVQQPEVARYTDEGLMVHLDSAQLPPAARALLAALRMRRLHKRAYEAPAAILGEDVGEWIASDYALTRRVENALCDELRLPSGSLLLDFPAKTQMLGLDIPVLRRDGRVEQLTTAGWEGAINLPRLSDELYQSSRRLRVFTANRAHVPADAIVALVQRTAEDIRARLDGGRSLLA
ncbi:MAG: hypothetical protein H7Z40_23070, partial [Phycisphaerae bacterium]|nr:hypothetical protein [Gemmatimonadaceae bacterium]